jgi:HSP20 family protein
MDFRRFLPWRRHKADDPQDKPATRVESSSPATRFWRDLGGFSSLTSFAGGAFAPTVDMAQTDGSYVIHAHLRGMSDRDVTITTYQGVLTIKGEQRQEREDRSRGLYFVERRHGVFYRSLTLPVDAVEDGAEASFKDGVLTIQIPRSREARPGARMITVKTE